MDYLVVIKLTSKYTGEVTWLGSMFIDEKEAHKYIDKNVCKRCNSVGISAVPKDWHWIDRHRGFGPIDDVVKNNARKKQKDDWLRTGRSFNAA